MAQKSTKKHQKMCLYFLKWQKKAKNRSAEASLNEPLLLLQITLRLRCSCSSEAEEQKSQKSSHNGPKKHLKMCLYFLKWQKRAKTRSAAASLNEPLLLLLITLRLRCSCSSPAEETKISKKQLKWPKKQQKAPKNVPIFSKMVEKKQKTGQQRPHSMSRCCCY